MIEYNGKFVMFGGILEITKESDEVFIFDPTTNIWTILESHITNNEYTKSGTYTFKDDTLDSERAHSHPRRYSPSNFKKSKNT